jgi:hypothetical protein
VAQKNPVRNGELYRYIAGKVLISVRLSQLQQCCMRFHLSGTTFNMSRG